MVNVLAVTDSLTAASAKSPSTWADWRMLRTPAYMIGVAMISASAKRNKQGFDGRS